MNVCCAFSLTLKCAQVISVRAAAVRCHVLLALKGVLNEPAYVRSIAGISVSASAPVYGYSWIFKKQLLLAASMAPVTMARSLNIDVTERICDEMLQGFQTTPADSCRSSSLCFHTIALTCFDQSGNQSPQPFCVISEVLPVLENRYD